MQQIHNPLAEPDKDEVNEAATKIQAFVRGNKARKDVKAIKDSQVHICTHQSLVNLAPNRNYIGGHTAIFKLKRRHRLTRETGLSETHHFIFWQHYLIGRLQSAQATANAVDGDCLIAMVN